MKNTGTPLDSLIIDENRNPVNVGSGILTTTGTQLSPLAYLTASSIALNIPDTACELILRPTTDLNVSEDSTFASYMTVSTGITQCIPIAKMQTIYIKGTTADGTLNFYFVTV